MRSSLEQETQKRTQEESPIPNGNGTWSIPSKTFDNCNIDNPTPAEEKIKPNENIENILKNIDQALGKNIKKEKREKEFEFDQPMNQISKILEYIKQSDQLIKIK